MPILAVEHVFAFKSDGFIGPARVCFVASPGHILSTELEGEGHGSEPITVDTVIDGTGCTLIPAFVDANINTAGVEADLKAFASYGITTVCDMSSTTPEVQAMRTASGSELGFPSYMASGTVAVAQGHSNQVYPLRETGPVRTPAEAEAFVHSRITGPGQADYIKVLADEPGLDDATLAALVDAAHRHGKMAIAHATQPTAFTRAVRAGFEIITPVPLSGIIDDDTVSEMAARGIACAPTLGMRRKMAPLLRELQGTVLGGSTPELSVEYDFEYALANVKKLHEGGVCILVGTDANQTSAFSIAVGSSLHDEMELLVRAGLSNLDALRAATVNSYRVFRLHDRGELLPGRRADLVLLEGNPVEDITATRRIRKVWVKGIEVERA